MTSDLSEDRVTLLLESSDVRLVAKAIQKTREYTPLQLVIEADLDEALDQFHHFGTALNWVHNFGTALVKSFELHPEGPGMLAEMILTDCTEFVRVDVPLESIDLLIEGLHRINEAENEYNVFTELEFIALRHWMDNVELD